MLSRCLAAVVLLIQVPLVRSVDVWSTDPIAVDIEWVTIDADGKQTLTARRQTAAGPPAPVEFAHAFDRFVRFRYQGASPRTYSTSELLTAKKLHVPDVLPGGELLIVSHQQPVRAARVQVDGPRAQTFALTSRHVSFAGVPPGLYTVTPVYEGGIKGKPVTATVKAAETSLLFLPAEDVGAVRVTTIDDVCRNATEMGINAIVTPDVGPQFKGIANRSRVFTADRPACDTTIAGLKPGLHEIYFKRQESARQTSALGTRDFTSSIQRIEHVDVGGPPVQVEGRVTMNGKPAPNTAVVFSWRGDRNVRTPAAAETKTDAGGCYRVSLDMPGKYGVHTSPLGRMRLNEAELVEGRNVHDINIVGGSITIKLTGIDPKSQVSVVLKSGGYMQSNVFGGGHGNTLEIQALPWGEYTVSVSRGATRPKIEGTEPGFKMASLSEKNPQVTLTFDLTGR